MTIWIALGAITILLVAGITLYNKLVRMNVAVDESWAQIEVQLKRRADLIPALVETVKGYAAHERTALEAVVAARSQALAATDANDVVVADATMTHALKGLLAIAESYPDLKASTNFLALQEELSATENRVAFARQYYNERVRGLNTATATIPTAWVAAIAKVRARDFYEVPDPTDREMPTVRF